jgi:hypothetical protein
MTATPRMIRKLREQGRIPIDRELEALILQEYGTEPYPQIYTEQDLYEQIRKLIMRYNREHTHAAPSTQPTNEDPKGGCL